MMRVIVCFALLIVICQCKFVDDHGFIANFDNVNDRIWVGEDFWAVPLEDWQVSNSRLECVGNRAQMRVNVLSRKISDQGDLRISVDFGLISKGQKPGIIGLSLGKKDKTDNSTKSLCYFGEGLKVGIHTDGYVFIGDQTVPFPSDFDLKSLHLSVKLEGEENNKELSVKVSSLNGQEVVLKKTGIEGMEGLIALINDLSDDHVKDKSTHFWFDNLKISGSRIIKMEDEKLGPVLWTMYTQSEGVLKLSAQFPPLGSDDNHVVTLQIKDDKGWETVSEETIDFLSYNAIFSLAWCQRGEIPYRIRYVSTGKKGQKTHYYTGVIRNEPKGRPLKLAGLTCQEGHGFPYAPVVNNLKQSDPDLLFFSGDQIYEQNGGYQVIREPIDKSIINYLGKWYMFGWAFGDIMKDRPTVCLPDDHDVFQGNLWGNSGKSIGKGQNGGGYVMSTPMINAVHRTQCGHLPDPYDSSLIGDGISVYFTEMIYGGVSFAILSDRMFKSSPDEVCTWKGRSDHLKKPLVNPDMLEKPGLKMLGDRQLDFLDDWSTNWKGAYMKVLLSQTIFANVATHHGGLKGYLHGDLDSGGWPRSGRNRILERLRKCHAFHVCGDQHLPSIVQYGIDEYRDASWVFCTPAIYVGYERRFLPDRLGWPVNNRPIHNLPNTGNYTDAFGNPSYVYAIGQYEDNTSSEDRYQKGLKTTSGFGLVTFDPETRNIKLESIKFLADLNNAPERINQHEGWPKVINQFENGGNHCYRLPLIYCDHVNDPVVQIKDLKSGKILTSVRMKGKSYLASVPYLGQFEVIILDPEKEKALSIKEMKSYKVK